MKRIILVCPGNLNFGDNAILFGWMELFNQFLSANDEVYVLGCECGYIEMFFPKFRYRCYCTDKLHHYIWKHCNTLEEVETAIENALDFNEALSQNDVLHPEILFLHRLFQKCDYVHFIGGGSINNLWVDVHYQTALVVRLAKQYGKKVIMTGQTIGPLDPHQRAYLEPILHQADWIDLRDSTELEYLQQINKNVTVTMDDVFLSNYLSIHADISAEEKNYLQTLGERPHINVCFQNWNSVSSEEYHTLLNETASFLNRYMAEHQDCWLYVLEMMPIDHDMELGKELISLIDGEICKRVVPICSTNHYPYLIVPIIQSAVMNIGTRFHLAVFSLSSTIPAEQPKTASIVLDTYYYNKISGIYSFLNTTGFVALSDYGQEFLQRMASHAKPANRQRTMEVVSRTLQRKMTIYFSSVWGLRGLPLKFMMNKFCKTSHLSGSGRT